MDETEVADPSAAEQTGGLEPVDLAVHGGVMHAQAAGEIGEGALRVLIHQHQGQELALVG